MGLIGLKFGDHRNIAPEFLPNAPNKKHVCVIGGGTSGLIVMKELTALGYYIIILITININIIIIFIIIIIIDIIIIFIIIIFIIIIIIIIIILSTTTEWEITDCFFGGSRYSTNN